MNLKTVLTSALLAFAACAFSQPPENIINYINTYKDLAIAEEIRTGIPAAIKLAQGIHETEAGNSDLVRRSNNHFGIKCKTGWAGDKVYHDDDARGECFRSYGAAEDSYRDHSDFLKKGQRYAFLFELDPTDYKGWAFGLKKAGYATNIRYSQILVKIIETYDLDQYTLIALEKIKSGEEFTVANTNTSSAVTGAVKAAESPASVNVEKPVVKNVQYPAGEFTINRAKVIYVSSGSSLLQIADKYELPLARLLDFNDLRQEDFLINDQLIFLQRKRKTGSGRIHIVIAGESVYDICQSEGIRLESLLQLNQLNSGMQPAPGEKLYLQEAAPGRPVLSNATNSGQVFNTSKK